MELYRRIFHIILLHFVWLGLSICCLAQSSIPNNEIRSRADQYLKALTARGEFNGSVLIARNGQVILSEGYGMANLEYDAPNSPQTKFRIGSITKQFTAMAILILQERGKLNLQDSICRYIDECPAGWQPITIHHLLTHSSGIPDLVRLPGFWETITLPTKLSDTIVRLKREPLEFKPGEQFKYGNSGYLISAFIIEKVSGKSYDGFLRENIYLPLKMFNSGYARNDVILKNRASGYSRKEGKIVNAPYIDMSIPIGAGSQYSTVDDLFLWDQALYKEKLVSKRALDAMFTPFQEDYGYGWEITRQFNRRVIEHIGDINGFGAYIARYPDDQIFVVVLSNFESTRVKRINRDLAAIVFGQEYSLPE